MVVNSPNGASNILSTGRSHKEMIQLSPPSAARQRQRRATN